MAKEQQQSTSPGDGSGVVRPPKLQRTLAYARGYKYTVEVNCCDDYDCGISTYYVEPVKEIPPLDKKARFTFFGFTSNVTTDDQAVATQEEVYFLAHMYVPWYFDQMKLNKKPIKVKDDLAKELPPSEDDDSALGLFMLKQYSLGDDFNKDQPLCRKRGEFGCPLTLHIPKDPKLHTGRHMPGDEDEVLGFFTFNGMRFYPFLMIDYTVCYYVCDARGAHDWNRHPDGHVKKWYEIFPLVALDAPVSYEPTLGIWMTRSAHLMPVPSPLEC